MRSLKYKSLFIFAALVFGAVAAADGQTTKSAELSSASPSTNVNVVNTPTVGIDPAKNTVQVANSASGPLAVVVTNMPVRRPFQARINLDIPSGANANSGRLNIPVGKRLIIENVSALTSGPQGLAHLLNFTTSVQNIIGDNSVGGFESHDVLLSSQGLFNGVERLAANQNLLAFADESVQTPNGTVSGLDVIVNFSRASLIGFSSVRVTITGYVEDVPAQQ
jgi:hypothetical protein